MHSTEWQERELMVRRFRLHVEAIIRYGLDVRPAISPLTGKDYSVSPTGGAVIFWFEDKFGLMAIHDGEAGI
jgi:hypothetical protein